MDRIRAMVLLLVVGLLVACGGQAAPVASNTSAPMSAPATAAATSAPGPTTAPAPTTVPTTVPTVAPTNTPAPTSTTAPTNTAAADLDAERTVDVGGYAYQPVKGWKVETEEGFTTLQQPGDEKTAAGIVLIGGAPNDPTIKDALAKNTPLDALLDSFLQSFSQGSGGLTETLNTRKDVTVSGVTGRAVAISGTSDNLKLQGEMALVRVSPTDIFVIFSAAPADKWATVQAQYQAVLRSVRLYPPKPAATQAADTATAGTNSTTGAATSTTIAPDASASAGTGSTTSAQTGGAATIRDLNSHMT